MYSTTHNIQLNIISDNTVRRRCGVAKQFFRAAIRKDIIEKNPFEGVKVVVQPNRARMYFITTQESEKVFDACPDQQWRLIFALCRYGGLRCPSEVLGLRWTDIDWARSRMIVHSPKTEHHHGKDMRIIPLYPELLPHLQEAFDLRLREQSIWLRGTARRILIFAHPSSGLSARLS